MKKRDYLSPQMKERTLRAHRMLCASTKSMYEVELESNGFVEE